VTAPLLEVRGLRTQFETRHGTVGAVDGVDLDVWPGRTLGLVGESGCGKSATALSLMGLIDRPGSIVEGSSIKFAGEELVGKKESELARFRGDKISMIFQEPLTSLNPRQTIGAQVIEAVRSHRRVARRVAGARALEMLELVGIPSPARRLDSYAHELSGGMRQRVMIAIALACEPSLLIADEPTTALDVTIQAEILELLRDLRDQLGMAMLLITHDLGVVAEIADDVAVMYAGRIVHRGPVADVFIAPQHPYTEALLRSVPVIGMTQHTPLHVIAGAVPSPLGWPSGCRFRPRCEFEYERCADDPPLMSAGTQHAACWLCSAGPRETQTALSFEEAKA
jgi:oligopeptide/dipeptide ABC transporter ATP-binding protein